MTGRIRTLFLLIFLIFILAGCLISDSQSKDEEIMELNKVKVMVLPFLSFAPFFIAQEEGYFAEWGIEVEFDKFGSPVQAMPALIQGDLDVAAGGVSASLFNSIARGVVNIKIVADKGHLDSRCSYAAILVNKELFESGELSEIAQLKGKKFAGDDLGGMGYAYSEMLSKGNLGLEDIETVTMPPPERVAALQSKAVAAAHIGEPLITKLSDAGIAVKLAGQEETLPGFQLAYLIYGPNFLEKDGELGRQFMVAYLKGVRQYNEGKTERNIEIIQKYTQLDKDLIERACWPSINSNGRLNTQSLLDVQDWDFENGYVDEKVTEDQLFDESFIEYANEVLS
jgi:NitT/TauT family transport system substrate-binding protein